MSLEPQPPHAPRPLESEAAARVVIEDLVHLRIPTDVRLAPDGRSLVWVERRTHPETGKTLARLMRAREGEAARSFTAGDFVDGSPRFSPDGRHVAFLRTRPSDGAPVATQLCTIACDGGEARVLLAEVGSFGAPAWSPEGRWLAVAFRRADKPPEGEKGVLSIRVDRLHYKLDGEGYLPRDRYSLYQVDTHAAAPALVAITDPEGDWDDHEPAWSPDGTRLAFVSNRRSNRDRDVENGDIFVIGAHGGEAVQCTHARGTANAPVWSPGGGWLLAALGVGPPGAPLFRTNIELYRIDASGLSEEESLTADLDRCVLNLTLDDLWGLDFSGQPPALVEGGRRVLLPVSDQGSTWLGALALDAEGRRVGDVVRLVDDCVVVCFDAAPAVGRVALLTTTTREPGRLEVCDLGGRDRRVWAWPLESYCLARTLAEPIEVRTQGPDGTLVHGWLLQPEGDGPFPLLLDIHGGPCVQFGPGFFHEKQTFVAKGFAVLFINPRGSQGYGADFAAAIYQDWGPRPFTDLMTAVDYVLERYPLDPERMGVMGGSYGGYMTTWVVAHTHRFKAACVQRTVSSMEAMIWCDFGASIADEVGATPWEDKALYERLSPMTYLAKVETPVLVLQGLADQRTPADQGERLFVMLRLLDKKTEMVLFPGGTHGLSRGGQPRQRVERLRVIHEWFERHLKS